MSPFLFSCVLSLTFAAPVQEEADHAALRELRALYENAIRQDDLEKLRPFVAKDFTGVMVTHHAVEGLEGMKKYWAEMKKLIGEGGKYAVTIEPGDTWLHGDIAVAKGSSKESVTTGGGKEFAFDGRWTAVLQKQDGSWKLLRSHASMDPIENAFVKADKQGAQWLAGGVMLAVGLLVGWLLGARVGKR